MTKQKYKLQTDKDCADFMALVGQMRLAGKAPAAELICERGTRTSLQNASLHLWLAQVATTLNDAGQERVISGGILSEPIELPWTMESVKECIWHKVQKALTGYESTADASTTDYPAVAQVITRHLGQTFGITVPPWPTRFTQGSEDD